jgi:hypothetical protein
MPGKRAYYPDEEPESTFIDGEHWFYKGCHFCGQETHLDKDCPSKPLPKIKGAK